MLPGLLGAFDSCPLYILTWVLGPAVRNLDFAGNNGLFARAKCVPLSMAGKQVLVGKVQNGCLMFDAVVICEASS